LSTAEFAYKTSLNRITDKKTHKTVYSVRAQSIDHIHIAEHYKASQSKFT